MKMKSKLHEEVGGRKGGGGGAENSPVRSSQRGAVTSSRVSTRAAKVTGSSSQSPAPGSRAGASPAR